MCLAGSNNGVLLLGIGTSAPMQGEESSVAEAQGQHVSEISGV